MDEPKPLDVCPGHPSGLHDYEHVATVRMTLEAGGNILMDAQALPPQILQCKHCEKQIMPLDTSFL